MKKVSVIVPVYNVAPYLQRSIESLLAQTLTDFEAIFINDGSTDGSLGILKEYAKQDSRIQVISQPNAGAGAARNRGLSAASGKYVYFMDPDDWLEPDLLSDNTRLMWDNKLDLIVFRFRNIYPGLSRSEDNSLGHSEIITDVNAIRRRLYEINMSHDETYSIYLLWNKMYDLSLAKQIGLQFTHDRSGEDALFNLALFPYVKRLGLNEGIYYNYRVARPDSLTSSRYSNFPFDVKIHDAKWAMFRSFGFSAGYAEDTVGFVWYWSLAALSHAKHNGGLSRFRELCRQYSYTRHLCTLGLHEVKKPALAAKYMLSKFPVALYLLAQVGAIRGGFRRAG